MIDKGTVIELMSEGLASETLAATEGLGLLRLLHLGDLLHWRRGEREHVLRERWLTRSARTHLQTDNPDTISQWSQLPSASDKLAMSSGSAGLLEMPEPIQKTNACTR